MMNKLDRRNFLRYPVCWKMAIMPGHGSIREIHHGQTQNLSLGGASLLCHHYPENAPEDATIFLFVATQQIGHKPAPIKARVKVLLSPPATDRGCFRLSLEFAEFYGDAWLVLSEILAARTPAINSQPGDSSILPAYRVDK